MPWTAKHVAYGDVARVRDSLGCPEPLAWTLVRRGLSDPEAAREFLAADGALDPPAALAGVAESAERLARAVDRGERITVHGDYDCDGISSTAMLTRALRARGGIVDTFLPSRFTDGYGVSSENVEKLAEAGTQVLVCVDCGTTAVEALTLAHERGMDTIVLDHHLAGGRRPPGLLANPALGRGDDALPSAAGVVLKVARALSALDGDERLSVDPLAELDLAALATVADAVPLRGENRRVVAQGIKAIRENPRVGIKALMDAAGADHRSTDARTLGFTVGPAVNAAGRLDHPSRALDLLLETDPGAARPVAERLWALNSERRDIERQITEEAIAQFEASPDEIRQGAAIVVGSEGWHEGVVGIVASRLTERFERPAIVISINGDQAKGSGRSVPGVDLHGLVSQADEVLTGWGGHEGAVGVQLLPGDIATLRRDLMRSAEGARADIERSRVKRVDAVVAGADLSLGSAEALEQLAPFGRGNAGVSLLIPGAGITGVSTVGQDGRHLRLGLASGGTTSRSIGFSMGHRAPQIDQALRHDVVAGLAIERWQDTVGPRVTLKGIDPLPERDPRRAKDVRAALASDASRRTLSDMLVELDGDARPVAGRRPQAVVDVRGSGSLARVVALSGADNGVVAVVGRTELREPLFSGVLAPSRLRSERLVSFSGDRDAAAARELLDDPRGGAVLGMSDYGSLNDLTLPDGVHLVAVDPPGSANEASALLACAGGGWLHMAWGEEEVAFALQQAASSGDLRAVAARLWPLLSAERLSWDQAAKDMAGVIDASGRRTVGAAVAALAESGLVDVSGDGVRRVDGAPRADLTVTQAARRAAERALQRREYLATAATLQLAPAAPEAVKTARR